MVSAVSLFEAAEVRQVEKTMKHLFQVRPITVFTQQRNRTGNGNGIGMNAKCCNATHHRNKTELISQRLYLCIKKSEKPSECNFLNGLNDA